MSEAPAMSISDRRSLAILASHQAAFALASLVAMAKDADLDWDFDADLDETIHLLLDASKLSLDLAGDLTSEKGQVYGALVKFFDGWAG